MSASATSSGTAGPGPGVTGAGAASPRATLVVRSTPSATPTSGTPTGSTFSALGQVDLRYRLVDRLGRPLFCDPDLYPVARADEIALAQDRFPAIHADTATYMAITAQLGIDPATAPTTDQVLAIYSDWKMLRALVLEPTAGGFTFDYVAAPAAAAQQAWHVSGSISDVGTISLSRHDPSGSPPCPICLARGSLISTPGGPVPVEDLRPGMAVWTADASGALTLGIVLVVGSTPVSVTHRVIHLVLADGRTLDVSPGHRLRDGRRLGDLRVGDLVDGSPVISTGLVPYAGGATFDLLPSGATGSYWAGGIPLASTLLERPW